VAAALWICTKQRACRVTRKMKTTVKQLLYVQKINKQTNKKTLYNSAPYISPLCHRNETILFSLEKLIQVETTRLSVKYENKKVTLKL